MRWAWRRLGGLGGPVALRIVPALAGIALIPLVAALARRVAGDAAALWAALFTALVPAAVLLSDFARMYSLAAAFTVAAGLLLVARHREARPRSLDRIPGSCRRGGLE